jgi:nucleoside-diphosphate-sugar epimerase
MGRLKMRIAITGAAGLLGSNLLYEIINYNLNNFDNLELIILGRNVDTIHLKKRIYNSFFDESRPYLVFKNKAEEIKTFFKEKIQYVNFDLNSPGLKLSEEGLRILKHKEIDLFYHVAALPDLRLTKTVAANVNKTNVIGTEYLLDLIKELRIGEFLYVGTAYASGVKTGIIPPDYANVEETFNNAYEKTKLLGELKVRQFQKETGVKCRYFRPSVICGRLIDGEIGATNKFDVFYQYCTFFLYLKSISGIAPDKLFSQNLHTDIRMYYVKEGGLNITPVDYIAKVMYQICYHGDENESYNLVNENDTMNDVYIDQMLEFISVSGVTHINKKPEVMNKSEKIYYKHCGDIFQPYLTFKDKGFDKNSLTNIHKITGISCPTIDKKNFDTLLKYAQKYAFGLKQSK